MKKIFTFVFLLTLFCFVGLNAIYASGTISVQYETYTDSGTPTPGSPISNKSVGDKVSVSNMPDGYDFKFYAINDIVRDDLVLGHEFTVRQNMKLTMIFAPTGENLKHVIVFADTNGRILEVDYVLPNQSVEFNGVIPSKPQAIANGWITSEGLAASLSSIQASAIYFVNYTSTNVSSYTVNVNGGTADKTSYGFNEVAEIVADEPEANMYFSHFEDAKGNKLSFKSPYKVTVLGNMSITAIYSASVQEIDVVVNMSESLSLRAGYVSYKGQFELPSGYQVVEYGFIFSRSSDILDLNSLGATVVPSNVHNGVTGEFLRSFPDDTFNSIRAYLIVLNTVTEQTEVFYSENYKRNPEPSSGASFYTTFSSLTVKETTENNDLSISYNSQSYSLTGTKIFVSATSSDSSNSLKLGSSSAKGYVQTGLVFTNISLITLKLQSWTGDNTQVKISLSSDGLVFKEVQILTLSESFEDYIVNVDLTALGFMPSESLSVRIEGVAIKSRFFIDDFSISSTVRALHEVTYNVDGLETAEMIIENSVINYIPTKPNYVFAGWYLDSGFEVVYTNSPLMQSQYLYAKFTPESRTITFNYNGADGGEMPVNILAEIESFVELPVPTKVGYDFAGWFNESETTQYNTPYQVPTVNRNMYAKWDINDLGRTMLDAEEITLPTEITEATTLTLTKTGSNGSSIDWSSSTNQTIINLSTGVVTLPDETTTVTLTATLSLNGQTTTATFDIQVFAADDEPSEPVLTTLSLTTSNSNGTYPTQYGTASWLLNSITFSGTGLTRNGSSVEYTIQGNSKQSSKITSSEMGIIQSISIRVPNTGSSAETSAKFYVELSSNSNFTNSTRYNFGSGYTSTTNIDLSQHSGTVTVATVLNVKDSSTSTPSIVIDASSHNSTYVRFVWESGATYIAQIDISYLVNPS